MSAARSASIFESINARGLMPSQVARTFVPSVNFEKLAYAGHNFIVGPRGSGKTTLLKMLQIPALEAWNHQDADSYRKRITYPSVFVPADLIWGEQIQSLGGDSLDPRAKQILGVAAFTTHVLRATVETALQRIRYSQKFLSARLSDQQEAMLVRSLCKAWYAQAEIPSLLALKHGLTVRLSRIVELANTIAPRSDAAERLAEIPFLHLPFVQSAAVAASMFNDLVGEPDRKWALLFDELELAPNGIQQVLLRAPRSTDQIFHFKIAINPITSSILNEIGPLRAQPDQDFVAIPLWFTEKGKAERQSFCEQLWYSILKDRSLGTISPKQALGGSFLEEGPESPQTHYRPHSRIVEAFQRLSEADPSFRAYLNSRKPPVDLRRLSDLSEEDRASFIRKITPIVMFRDFLLKRNPRGFPTSHERTRKATTTLFTGAESLFSVSEGNPRWFIALVNRLLSRRRVDGLKIQRSVQGQEIRKLASRFEALLRTIPRETANQSKQGVLTLVDLIGRYFKRQLVAKSFNPDPFGTFRVDSRVSREIVSLLDAALNAGAIVYVPSEEGELILTSPEEKRFRLCYLLAAKYALPLRLEREAALSRIIESASQLAPTESEQLSFEEIEDAHSDS
jgi:hypothetical protein